MAAFAEFTVPALLLRNYDPQTVTQVLLNWNLQLVSCEVGIKNCWLHRMTTSISYQLLWGLKRRLHQASASPYARKPFSKQWLFLIISRRNSLALLMTVKSRKTLHSLCLWQTYKSPPKREATKQRTVRTLSQGCVAFCFIRSQSSFEPVKHLPYQVLWLLRLNQV